VIKYIIPCATRIAPADKKKHLSRFRPPAPHEPGSEYQAALAGAGMNMVLRHLLAVV
jgi:hypothetical protein